MAASTTTSVAYIYKSKYSERQVADMAQREHPLWKMINKEGGMSGAGFVYSIRVSQPQGINAVFGDAQTYGASTNTGSSRGKQLTALRKKKYAVITLDGEALKAAEDNKGAFVDLVTNETDGVLNEFSDHLAFDLYRDGNGIRGRRSSLASQTVTLSVADDARNFKPGMPVGASANADGSSPRVGATFVTAIDEDAGTVTLNSQAAITSFADNDYMFIPGDPAAGAEGLAALFPLSAPTSGDSFRGIDRSTNPRALAGVRIDDTATSIEENAGLCAVKIRQSGKRGQILFLNPVKFHEVVKRQGARVVYDGGGAKAAIGFESFAIYSPGGTLQAVSDPDCPTTRGYVLNMDNMLLKHLGGLPHIIDDDGMPELRQSTSDGIEARARVMWNVIAWEPGSCGVISI